MQVNSGCCGCGQVKYNITSEFLNIVNCHCSTCRSFNGTPFSTYGVVTFKSLEVIQGSEVINKYSIDGGTKHFCGQCGTPLFSLNEKYIGLCMIFVGTLNTLGHNIPKVNIWCEDKLGWINGIADILSLDKGVPSKNT